MKDALKNEKQILKGLKYAVFGLGSSIYENFCTFGKFCNSSIEALGKVPLMKSCGEPYNIVPTHQTKIVVQGSYLAVVLIFAKSFLNHSLTFKSHFCFLLSLHQSVNIYSIHSYLLDNFVLNLYCFKTANVNNFCFSLLFKLLLFLLVWLMTLLKCFGVRRSKSC